MSYGLVMIILTDMKKKKNEDFILVGHLQVLDEALSSLYSDRKSGQYFLFVRVYEDEDDNTFVLTQVQPSVVLDYIDGKVGLKQIFSLSPSYFYKQVVQNCMRREDFVPIDYQEVDFLQPLLQVEMPQHLLLLTALYTGRFEQVHGYNPGLPQMDFMLDFQ